MFNAKKGNTKPKSASKVTTRQVHYDAFGNAIPDLPSVHKKAAEDGKSRIVETRQIVVETKVKDKPSVNYHIDLWQPWNTFVHTLKNKKIPKEKALNPYPPEQTQSENAKPEAQTVNKSKVPVVVTPEGTTIAPQPKTETEAIKPEYVHQAMYEMHRQFEQREERMEKRFNELTKHHEKQAKTRKKTKPWLMASAIVCSAGGAGYLLFIMQSIQTSMLSMTQDMNSMTTGIEQMVDNTGDISGTMNTMNNSMNHLNGNVAYMNHSMFNMTQNVGQMNYQMQNISRSIKPMGQAAQSVSPFMKMFGSFMPF